MPRMTVTVDDPRAGAEPLVLFDESVEPVHVSNKMSAEQLLERVRWALADAERASQVRGRGAALARG